MDIMQQPIDKLLKEVEKHDFMDKKTAAVLKRAVDQLIRASCIAGYRIRLNDFILGYSTPANDLASVPQ